VRKTGTSGGGESSDGISVEMILSGILTIFAYDKNNAHLSRYKKILLRVRPNIKRELIDMAVFKARNDDFELAEEICRALDGIAPDDPYVALTSASVQDLRGAFFRQSGLFDDADACDEEARALYRKALREDIPDAHFSAASFYLRTQDFARAKSCFETFLALAHGSGGEDEENVQTKIERAVECINMIDTQNLDDELYKKAYSLISSGEEGKGIGVIREFLEKNAGVWKAWFLLGWGLRLLERFDDARQAFLRAEQCEGGKTADTYNELAICCMESGLLEKSESYLKKAIQLNPQDSKIMSNMGVLLRAMKRFDDARTWFLTALEFNPDDIVAKRSLDELECDGREVL
jgi:Flp pilus assembly protein TadD